MQVKQVIVMRKEFPDGKGGTRKLRRGKEIAQACHASTSWLVDFVKSGLEQSDLSKEQFEWMVNGRFTKVCLQVDTEEQLMKVYDDAKEAGLTVHLITDSGVTEFSGEPTNTCLAIGPNKSEDIDKITGKLQLY
jgi:peptidyl-tRNA hydrolase, PTH2 family